MRVLAFGMAAMLALILVATAGHHHDRKVEAHACSVCAMLMDEVPGGADGLPPLVAGLLAQSYLLLGALVYVCLYRSPLLIPPGRGPPACPSAT